MPWTADPLWRAFLAQALQHALGVFRALQAVRLVLDALDGYQQLRLVLFQASLQGLDLGHLAAQAFEQLAVLPGAVAARQQASDLLQGEAGAPRARGPRGRSPPGGRQTNTRPEILFSGN